MDGFRNRPTLPIRSRRYGSTLAGLRVLVVEDNMVNLKLFLILLEGQGCVVRSACNTVDALATTSAFRPAIVVLDLHLPGKDGLDFARELRSHHEHDDVALLAVTAYSLLFTPDAAIQAGCDSVLTKPIEAETLFAAVRSTVEGHRKHA